MLSWLATLDGGALLWLQEYLRGPLLTAFFTCFTQLGNAGILWIVLAVGLLCFRRTRKAGACALLAMLLGLLCTNVILKQLVQRPRPWLLVEGLLPLVAEGDPNSFPSGHTTAAFAAGIVWLRTLPWKWGRAAALVSVLDGLLPALCRGPLPQRCAGLLLSSGPCAPWQPFGSGSGRTPVGKQNNPVSRRP